MDASLATLLGSNWLRNVIAGVAAIVAASGFLIAVMQYIGSIVIRRYEKFHEMSVRFDEDDAIQRVCRFLEDPSPDRAARVTRQDKEEFICFLEEIYFMINSGVMKRDLALYTFGYYAQLAFDDKLWDDETKRDHPFFVHFVEFCRQAKEYKPDKVQRLVY